jgi:hypothetical protein
MFSVDEMKLATQITLPGKIVEVVGCKKVGDNQVSFSQDGAVEAGGEASFDRAKGVYVLFQIPEGTKIKFSKPDAKPAEKKPEPKKEEDADKKKGGLGLDRDG